MFREAAEGEAQGVVLTSSGILSILRVGRVSLEGMEGGVSML